MSEKELQRLRRAILKGVCASTEKLFYDKKKNNFPIEVMGHQGIQIIEAKELSISFFNSQNQNK